jgi:hypothetical protein
MITTAILKQIFNLVYLLCYPIRQLPDVTLSSNIATSIATASGYMNSLSFALPISTIFVILISVVTIEGFVFSYKTIMWVVKRFPTQS